MPVTEAYMAPGDFRVTLREDTPRLLGPLTQTADYTGSPDIPTSVTPFGYVIVVPQWIGRPENFTVANLMAAARYTGIVLETQWVDGRLTVHGAGLDWLFGDESTGIGPRTSSLLSTTWDLAGLWLYFDVTLELGDIAAGGPTHEISVAATVHKAIIRTAHEQLGAHYRIRPDGHVDAEFIGDGNIFVETPTMIAVADNAGGDALWTGIPASRVESRQSARSYLTAVQVGTASSFTYVSGGHAIFGLFNNGMRREELIDPVGTTTAGTQRTRLGKEILRERGIAGEHWIRLDQWQSPPVAGGRDTVHPGDQIYVWDPQSGFSDAANGPIWFRGQCIAPLKMRAAETEWPLVDGMGVYYLHAGTNVAWATAGTIIDLTPFVEWDATPADAATLIRADQPRRTTT